MTKRKKDYLNMQIQFMKELSMVTLSMEKESLQIPKAYIEDNLKMGNKMDMANSLGKMAQDIEAISKTV